GFVSRAHAARHAGLRRALSDRPGGRRSVRAHVASALDDWPSLDRSRTPASRDNRLSDRGVLVCLFANGNSVRPHLSSNPLGSDRGHARSVSSAASKAHARRQRSLAGLIQLLIIEFALVLVSVLLAFFAPRLGSGIFTALERRFAALARRKRLA